MSRNIYVKIFTSRTPNTAYTNPIVLRYTITEQLFNIIINSSCNRS
jgi:hypothetical protein